MARMSALIAVRTSSAWISPLRAIIRSISSDFVIRRLGARIFTSQDPALLLCELGRRRPFRQPTKTHALFHCRGPSLVTTAAPKAHRASHKIHLKALARENLLGVVALAAAGMKYKPGQFHARNGTPLTCIGAFSSHAPNAILCG
jgi:hypothetical protein